MTKIVTITDRARIAAATTLEAYYRNQVEALTQLCLDHEAEIATVNADRAADAEAHIRALDEQEAGFLARIAGLEDELRQARSESVAVGAQADGE